MAKGVKKKLPETEFSQINIKGIPTDLLKKLQHIADSSDPRHSYTEVYIEAFKTYLNKWEEKNGKVKIAKLPGKGIKVL